MGRKGLKGNHADVSVLLYHHDAGHHLVPLLKVIRKLAEVSELVALLVSDSWQFISQRNGC